ncbi:hypothetical protein JL100_018060 [Skermanella mucosa]|uniref:hypothetical protein n=1 Tax=Skermanella mucosa TaxID=1789672 RepID=UPI00192B0224|nr:hypothetical protein [Skermanella mucosa]UEM18991.1 hypothetical protein JL100_018060 [Skermanella mucosa]
MTHYYEFRGLLHARHEGLFLHLIERDCAYVDPDAIATQPMIWLADLSDRDRVLTKLRFADDPEDSRIRSALI